MFFRVALGAAAALKSSAAFAWMGQSVEDHGLILDPVEAQVDRGGLPPR